jgi:hypothetical protein
MTNCSHLRPLLQALDPHPGDEDDPVSQNGYTYAGNNPVINVDPDGDFFGWQ